jgi:flagellar basal-body rod protein FlgB
MLERLTATLDFNAKALVLRADRQRIIASNIANVDTPSYVARDFNFSDALGNATKSSVSSLSTAASSLSGLSTTHKRHLELTADGATGDRKLGYAVATQPSMDGNSVDLDRERAVFADNALRYESTLRFINGQVKTMLSAIQGQ